MVAQDTHQQRSKSPRYPPCNSPTFYISASSSSISILCISMNQDPTWTELEQCVLLYVQMIYPRGQWSYKTDKYNRWPPRIPRTQPSLTAAWRKMGNKKFDDFLPTARQNMKCVGSFQSRMEAYNADSPDYWPIIPLHDRKAERKDHERPSDESTYWGV